MSESKPVDTGLEGIDCSGIDLNTEAWTPAVVLKNIIARANTDNPLEHGDDDTRTDCQRVQDFANDLNDEVIHEGLQHTRVHVKYSRTKDSDTEDTNDIHSMHGLFYDFVPYFSRSTAENWGYTLGVRLRTTTHSNFSAATQETLTTIPIDDPRLKIEVLEESFFEAREDARTRLETEYEIKRMAAEENDQLLFPRDFDLEETLEALIACLETDNMQPKNIRKMAKLVTRLVNSDEYMQNPALQDDVEILLHRNFEPGRYKLAQNRAAVVAEDENTPGKPMYQPIKRHSNLQLDGSLVGVVLLPALGRKKHLIPYFVLSPTATSHKENRLQIAPLENTTSMIRVGDATYVPHRD